jgi:uncharacterized protein YjbJ (UPF0337 family)
MATREQVLGNWNQLKGKVKEHWGQLTDKEIDEVKGNIDQLIGVIQRKTGEARGQIERFLDQLSDDAGGVFVQASEKAREYMSQGADAMRGAADQVREQAGERIERAQALVKRHPAEAVAVAFGTGLIVGVVVGLACRSR